MKIFSKERALTPSWKLVKPCLDVLRANFTQVVYLYLLPSITLALGLLLLGSYDFQSTPTSRQSQGMLITFVALFWVLLTTPGFIYLQYKAVTGRAVGAYQAFRTALPRIGALIVSALVLFAAAMVVFIAVTAPFAANSQVTKTAANLTVAVFLVMLLFWLRYFALAPYYIVVRKAGPVEGLRSSYTETKGVSAWMWGTVGVLTVFTVPAMMISYKLPGIGDILSMLILLPYSFAFAFRFAEVADKQKIRQKQPVNR